MLNINLLNYYLIKGGSLLSAYVSDGSVCVYDLIAEEKIADLEFGGKIIPQAKFDNNSNFIRFLTSFENGHPFICKLHNNKWEAIEFGQAVSKKYFKNIFYLDKLLTKC